MERPVTPSDRDAGFEWFLQALKEGHDARLGLPPVLSSEVEVNMLELKITAQDPEKLSRPAYRCFLDFLTVVVRQLPRPPAESNLPAVVGGLYMQPAEEGCKPFA